MIMGSLGQIAPKNAHDHERHPRLASSLNA